MATRITQPAEHLYEQDFYAWSRRQAELLRAGRFSDLDLGHLAEEVEDLRENVYRSVRSRVRTIGEHLLKLEHSSASEPNRGWRETIRTQRADLDEDLTAALQPRIEAGLPASTAKPAVMPPRRSTTTASRPPPTFSPRTARTPWIRSSAIGCRDRPGPMSATDL